MLQYIRIKFKQYTAIKCGIFGILMLTCILIGLNAFKSYSNSVIELTLLILTDKLFLSTGFTLIAVAFANDLFRNDPCEIQLIMRMKTVKKWYMSNLLTAFIVLSIFTLAYVALAVIVGSLSGYTMTNEWTSGITEQLIATGSCIEPFGYPLDAVLYMGFSPVVSLLLSWLFLMLRCFFFVILANLFSAICKKRIIGLIAAVILNFVDMFLFSMFSDMPPVFPYQHSSISAIDGSRASFEMSILYWLVLIIASAFIAYQYQTDMSENIMLSISQDS